MSWRTPATIYQKGQKRGSQASEELTKAYLDVFGNDNQSVEMVLADLANFTGFYKVPPPGTPPETLLYEQGLRAAYGRLFYFLSLPPDRLEDLEKAARAEALVDEEEGIL